MLLKILTIKLEDKKKKFHLIFEWSYLRPVGRVPLWKAFAQVAWSRVVGLISSWALHIQPDSILASHKSQTYDLSSLSSFIARCRTLENIIEKYRQIRVSSFNNI